MSSFWADYERKSRARIAAKAGAGRPRCMRCGEPVLAAARGSNGRRLCPTCIDDRANGVERAARVAAWRARQKEARA